MRMCLLLTFLIRPLDDGIIRSLFGARIDRIQLFDGVIAHELPDDGQDIFLVGVVDVAATDADERETEGFYHLKERCDMYM